MKTIILAASVFAAIPVLGQDTSTTEKQYEQICIANPNPPSWCKPQQKLPNKPLTDEQKALLTGTAPRPEPVDPKVTKSEKPPFPSSQTAPIRAATVSGTDKPTDANAPPPTVSVPAHQPDNSQQRQQKYDNSYALGSSIGSALGNVVQKHKITKWCSQHPGHDHWMQPDSGSRVYCDEWNSRMGTSSLEDLSPSETEAYEMMWKLQRDVNEVHLALDSDAAAGKKPDGFLLMSLGGLTRSWEGLRSSLCERHRGLPYTDLHRNDVRCK